MKTALLFLLPFVCADLSCFPKGTKVISNELNSTRCECKELWSGENCSVPLCFNNGTAVEEPACECPEYFKGEHCEETICGEHGELLSTGECACEQHWTGNHCDRPICYHDGSYGIETFSMVELSVCNCTPHWSGDHCEKIFCKNGGSAINDETECECPREFAGAFCEERDCLNGGYWAENHWLRMWECDCESGYSGLNCEIPECEHGTAVRESGDALEMSCKCESRWEGRVCDQCQYTVQSKFCCPAGFTGIDCKDADGETDWKTILGAIGGAAAIVAAIYCYLSKKKRQEDAFQNENLYAETGRLGYRGTVEPPNLSSNPSAPEATALLDHQRYSNLNQQPDFGLIPKPNVTVAEYPEIEPPSYDEAVRGIYDPK